LLLQAAIASGQRKQWGIFSKGNIIENNTTPPEHKQLIFVLLKKYIFLVGTGFVLKAKYQTDNHVACF
jgi:hypothetical protein